MEYIKVVVKTFSDFKKPESELFYSDKLKTKESTEIFFKNCFSNIECENCEENSKGQATVYLSDNGKSCMLDYDYKDFCCDSFMEKTRNRTK